MRIAYLSQSLLPSRHANAVHVVKMCQALARCGHDVTLYACYGDSNADLFNYYSVDRSFRVVRWKIPNIPGRFVVLALLTYLNLLVSKPSLIYARALFSLFLCGRLSIPCIYEVHAKPRTFIHQYLERRVFKRLNFFKLITINNALRQYYLHLDGYLCSTKITVAHDGADSSKERPAACNILMRSKSVKIVYTGSLNKGKGSELFGPLAMALPGFELHVVGGSDGQISKLKKTLQGAGITNVHFHGHVEHGNVPAYQRCADILVAPYQDRVLASDNRTSIVEWMSPLKIFEYMAAGRPIIASDLPAIREILEDGKNCLLCSPNSVEEWRLAVLRIVNEKSLAATLSRNSRMAFEQRYTWSARAKAVLGTLSS